MTTLTLQELTDDNTFETTGRMADGEVREGRDSFEALMPIEEWRSTPPEELARMFNGPRVVVSVEGAPPQRSPIAEKLATKQWVPYVGPQGGEGWQNAETGEVVYQDEPPGETVDPEELLEVAEEAGIDPEAAAELAERVEGVEPGDGPGPDPGELADDDGGPEAEPVEGRVDLSGLESGDRLTFEWAGRTVTGEVSRAKEGGDGGGSLLSVEVDNPELTNGRGKVTVDPSEVTHIGDKYAAEYGGQAAGRAAQAIDNADTGQLDERVERELRDRAVHDAGNAVDPDLAAKLFQHVGKYKQKGMHTSEPDRAYHKGRAAHAAQEDATSTIGLGESGSDAATITHEFGHGLADAFAYDTPGEKGTASDWSDFDGWDFGGEHDPKRDYMFSKYPDWEDRGRNKLNDYQDAAVDQSIDSSGEVAVGDRLAVVRNDGSIHEGTVTPNDRPYEGQTYADVFGHTPPEEGRRITVETEDGEMEGELRGQYDDFDHTVFVAFPDHEHRYDGWYSVDQIADLEGEDEADYVVKSPQTGDEMPLKPGGDEHAQAMLMREGENRDYVRPDEFSGAYKGEAVRFKLGTDEEWTEGVMTDENGAQVRVEWGEGDQHESKWVNKGQSFQQTFEIAEDRREFPDPRPSQSRPGEMEARWSTMDINEEDIDWDTYMRYRDHEETMDRLATDDLILVEMAGERVPAKVLDAYEGFGGETDVELAYPPDAADRLIDKLGAGSGSVPHGAIYEGSSSGAVSLAAGDDGDDVDIVGHKPAGEVFDDFRGVPMEPGDIDPDETEPGQYIEYTTPGSVVGGDNQRRGRVVEVKEARGNEFIEVESPTGENHTTNTDNIEIHAASAPPDQLAPEEDPAAPPQDPEEAAGQFIEEVNKSWFEIATKQDRKDRKHPGNEIGSSYSGANAHETLAKTHEAMQKSDGADAMDVFDRHRDLLGAYLDVFEPSDAVKERLNRAHEESYGSPFDETPFPEVEPEEVTLEEAVGRVLEAGVTEQEVREMSLSELEAFATGADLQLPDPETLFEEGDRFVSSTAGINGEVEVSSVVEGDLLLKDDTGEEYWLNPNSAMRDMTVEQAADVVAGDAGDPDDRLDDADGSGDGNGDANGEDAIDAIQETDPAEGVAPATTAEDMAERHRQSGRGDHIADKIENTLDQDYVPEEIHDYLATGRGALGFDYKNEGETVSINSQNFDSRVEEGNDYLVSFGSHNRRDQKVLTGVGELVEAPETERGEGTIRIGGEDVEIRGWQLSKYVSEGALEEAADSRQEREQQEEP